jgi:hypothetical protein
MITFKQYYELKAANSDMPASEEGSIDYRQATDNSTPADEQTADLQPSSVGTGSEGTGNDSLSGNTRAESGQGEMSDFETASNGHQLLPVQVILTQLQEMIQRNIVRINIEHRIPLKYSGTRKQKAMRVMNNTEMKSDLIIR